MAEPQVLIAGAGPTGLACALALVRHGVAVRIVAAAPGPGEASRAMVVQARTLELYDQMGFAAGIVEAGVKTVAVRIRRQGRDVASFSLASGGDGISPFPFALAYPQDDHERFLVAELDRAGVRVEWETALTGLEQDADGVRATLRHAGRDEVVRVPYLVGCDGAHSAVRHALELGFEGGAYEQLFYVADAEIEGGFVKDLVVGMGPAAFALMLPVRSRGVQRLIGVAPPGTQPGAPFEAVRGWAEGQAGARVKTLNWFSTYRVSHRVASRFRVGRCFIAGDAGHIHSPAGGQGMNTGIGDAVNLAWKLAAVVQGRAAPAMLDTYETERLGFARTLVATTDRAFRAVVSPSVIGRVLRRWGVPRAIGLLTRFAPVRRRVFGLVSQVRIAYRDSALSEGRAGAIRAGDRLPFVPGSDNFAPLRSMAWQVHVHGAAGPGCAALGVPVHAFAWTEAAGRAGYARDAAYLVRPDGYVGLAWDGRDAGVLRRYGAKWGLRAGG